MPHRRTYQRYLVDGNAHITADNTAEMPAILTDISSSGAGLLSNQVFKAKDRLAISIQASGLFKDQIQRNAVVAWCRPIGNNLYRLGIDFGSQERIVFGH